MNAPASPTVAVVGAGWAGLSAALRLAKSGYAVTLYDAAPHIGGRARGLDIEMLGRHRGLDNGQHLLIGAYSATQAILNEALVALSDPSGAKPPGSPAHQVTPFRLRQARAGQGRQALDFRRMAGADRNAFLSLLPQAGTALGLLFAKGLSTGEKIAFAGLMQQLKRTRFEGFEGQVVVDLLKSTRQPPALITKVWDPLCVSALNTGVDEACAQTFVNVLRDSLFGNDTLEPGLPGPVGGPGAPYPSDYLVPTVGLSEYFADPVLQAIRKFSGQIALRSVIRRLDDLKESHVILATPPYVASSLVKPQHTRLSEILDKFEYQSITTVYLAWDRAVRVESPLLLEEEPAQHAYGQWVFDRGFDNGIHVLAVVVSARGRYALLDRDQLSSNIARQVARQLMLPPAQAWKAITEKRATFSCTPGRPKLRQSELDFEWNNQTSSLPSLPPENETRNRKSVFLAGDYCYPRYPATLESAVRSGLLAASRLSLRHKNG